jgi:ATP-dependent Lhr-like helicase
VTLDRWRHLPSILSALEDLELPTLSWGVTEVTLSEDEVSSVLQEAVDAEYAVGRYDGPDEAEYLDELLRRGLLHRVPATSPPQYRTRLGEGVRLLRSNRQLFPPGRSAPPNWWQRGAPLVADYRLHVEPRRYPRRDVDWSETRAGLAQLGCWSDLQEALAETMLDGRQLAQFQLDAASSVLSGLGEDGSRGVVVGAGTGSGKTLAFYLPAFLALAPALEHGPAGTSILALYPRKELLRDQAQEALRTARRLKKVLERNGARPVRIGVLYGDTPYDSRDQRLGAKDSPWRRVGAGVRCPYFGCPEAGCRGDLVWADPDRSAGRERLTCSSCGTALPVESVALTRRSLTSSPADVVFTTTEMLSRNASDAGLGAILGWSGRSAPRLVLLDEVHTYTGVHGAQVGLTLRRWRHSLRRRGAQPPVFVGLSATLKDAVHFFATLTGLREEAVEYVTPRPADLVPSGRQYTVVLRGDPVSGASLLSTSLQTAMLLGRLLDPSGREFLFGSSGFIFTDDLDVTNRFYDDLRDAEGGQTRARPGVARKPVLAQLRSPEFDPNGAGGSSYLDRYREGQAWPLVREIGRPMSNSLTDGALRIGRTSSQDAGVDSGADLIVATASLEVGFNDPRVGLVMQHKAPRDTAAFLQRKGRAGRVTDMRPLTVVVLSDYGRDRAVYQGYEQLLDPEISARRLPVRNRYVLKIQAAQALLDWVSRRASTRSWVDARAVLRTPSEPGSTRPGADVVVEVLKRLLTDTRAQDELARHLESALDIPPGDAQAVLWEEPRSLLLSTVPTALRRLQAAWRSVDPDPGFRPGQLLPEHLTKSLFEPLNLPDVAFRLPFKGDDTETMPVLSALREAVPGRVSRRFGVLRDEHRTWLPVPPGNVIELQDIISRGHRIGSWRARGEVFEVVRPLELTLQQPPEDIADFSNARPIWGSAFVVPPPVTASIPVPHNVPWKDLVAGLRFALHLTGDPLEVRRMTIGSQGELARRDGSRSPFEASYAVDGVPAAMGYSLDVDALVVDCQPLDRSDPNVLGHLESSGWRARAFTVRVAEDPALEGIANSFQRGWLSLLYLTAYGVEAGSAAGGTDVRQSLQGGRWATDLPRMLGVLYRAQNPDDPAQVAPDRLVLRLQDLTANPMVVEVVERHADLLGTHDAASKTWDLAERAYADSWAAALRQAVLQTVPDADDTDLIVDVAERPDAEQGVRVIVSETSVGGLGLVEDLRLAYARDPSAFWSAVATAVRPSDYERMDSALRRLLTDVVENPDGECARAVEEFRSAAGALEADNALHDLIAAWTALDGPPRHLAVSAFSSRFLRPGAGPDTDRAALALLCAWDDLEDTIGAEVDARVIAYAAARGVLGGVENLHGMTADQVFSLLWPRGESARNHHLEHWQPFMESQIIDRLLISVVVERPAPQLDVSVDDWPSRFQSVLAEGDDVDLVAPAGRRDLLAAAIRRVPAIPVDRGALRVFARLGRVEASGPRLTTRCTVAEAYQ